MIFPESLLVVLACTLAGGVERPLALAKPNGTCKVGTHWDECTVLDETMVPHHLVVPWGVALACITFLSLPTILLRSKRKEEALCMVASNLFQCYGLMLCSIWVTDHPSIFFALSLHGCVLLLGRMEAGAPLVGGPWWWGMRYPVALCLLAWEVLQGPPLSVVRWPSTPQGTALPCAYLAHLAGAIAPDCVLMLLRRASSAGRSCICVRDG